MKTNLFMATLVVALSFTSCSDDEVITADVSARKARIVTTSNTTGLLSSLNVSTNSSTASISLGLNGTDNDGVYYDFDNDEVIVASRTNNRLETYTGLSAALSSGVGALTLKNSSTNTDFTNPREIAVSGDKVIVTQDQAAINGNTNKFYVYQRSAAGFTLLNNYTLDIKVWGIHFDGTNLYAVADLTGDLVVYNNFLSLATGSITPSKRVTIEGLTRTHGITFSSEQNRMFLTDVASAASATDGGLIVINNFTSVLSSTANLGTIALTNQIRLYGANTTMGNPVDVAYDEDKKIIYVAERLNNGGNLLTFDLPTTSGDVTPKSTKTEAGIAAVFFAKK